MAAIRCFHIARSGDRFTFEVRQNAGGRYDIYCTDYPQCRDVTASRCHLDPNGKIDAGRGKGVPTIDLALSIAITWADRYAILARAPAHVCNTAPMDREAR